MLVFEPVDLRQVALVVGCLVDQVATSINLDVVPQSFQQGAEWAFLCQISTNESPDDETYAPVVSVPIFAEKSLLKEAAGRPFHLDGRNHQIIAGVILPC